MSGETGICRACGETVEPHTHDCNGYPGRLNTLGSAMDTITFIRKDELALLKKIIEVQGKALVFYADPESYSRQGFPHGFCAIFNSIEDDYEKVTLLGFPSNLSQYGGKRARQALAEVEKLKQN